MRIRSLPLAVAAGATLVLGAVALASAPAALAAPKLTLSSSTVQAGQNVTVKGSGYPAEPTSLYMTLCANPPTATNCDVNLAHVTQITYNGSGGFQTKFTVAVTSFDTAAGKIDCAKTQCVIGTTNALSPKDHSYNAVAKITVGSSGGSGGKATPKPTPTKSQAASGTSAGSGSSGKETTSSGTGALASTGASGGPSAIPLVAGAGLAAVLGGLLLLIAVRPSPRPGRHAR